MACVSQDRKKPWSTFNDLPMTPVTWSPDYRSEPPTERVLMVGTGPRVFAMPPTVEVEALRAEVAALKAALEAEREAARKLRGELALEAIFAKQATTLARLAYKPSPDAAAEEWEAAARAYRADAEALAEENALLRVGVEHLYERSETRLGPREAFHRVWKRLTEAESIATRALGAGEEYSAHVRALLGFAHQIANHACRYNDGDEGLAQALEGFTEASVRFWREGWT